MKVDFLLGVAGDGGDSVKPDENSANQSFQRTGRVGAFLNIIDTCSFIAFYKGFVPYLPLNSALIKARPFGPRLDQRPGPRPPWFFSALRASITTGSTGRTTVISLRLSRRTRLLPRPLELKKHDMTKTIMIGGGVALYIE